MFDRRLFSLVPGLASRIAGKVACMWVNLLANITLVFTSVSLLGYLLDVADKHAPQLHVCIPAHGGCLDLMALINAYWFIGSDRTLIWQTLWPGQVIAVYLILFACIALIKFLATTLVARLGSSAAESVKVALREAVYRKMLSLGPSYAQRVKTADVIQSVSEGIDQVQSFYDRFLPQLVYAVLAPVTLFCVLAPVNLPAALVLLVCAPLMVLIVGLVAMRASRIFKKYWSEYTDLGSLFLDDVAGLETLKNFDADEDAARKLNEQSERFREMTMNVLQIQLRSLTAMDIVAYGGMAAGIGTAVWQYIHNGSTHLHLDFGIYAFLNGPMLTVAGALIIILLSVEFFLPLRQLGSYFHVAMNGMTSTSRIFALLDAPEPERGTQQLPVTHDSAFTLRLKGVAYSYADVASQNGNTGSIRKKIDEQHAYTDTLAPIHESVQTEESVPMALTNVTFTAGPGTLTTVVGKSGSGKTTLGHILNGSLTGYRGIISLESKDGSVTELANLTVGSLAQAVSMVGASSRLFTGTLRSNLLMARPSATEDEMMAALKRAHIDTFVEKSGGLDMPIAPDSANLSGGQRQRIAMAMVLLHDSPIIIFDEVTSSVDVDSENYLNETIRELARTKTVIQITHRLANTTQSDQVLVFDNGTVAECGAPADLMKQNGLYATMFRTQAQVESVGHREDGKRGLKYGKTVTAFGNDPATAGATGTAGTTGVSADASGLEGGTPAADAHLSDLQVAARLASTVRPLRSHMLLACLCGTVGHLAGTMVPVFGVMALFIATGNKVWGMNMSLAITLMAVCALLRGLMRYAEQYMNHNVAFRMLALFRNESFDALRRLSPAKLVHHGKGDLVGLVTTDVELLEIFFAHTISPVIIALATSILYIVAACALFNPMTALLMVVAYLVIGVLVPQLFHKVLNKAGVGAQLREGTAQLNDQMLDDMRGLARIIHFNQGDARLRMIMERSEALRNAHERLALREGMFAGLSSALVVLFSAGAAFLAINTSVDHPVNIAFNVTAFVLFVSSFAPTLALSMLPGNLAQTFAAARRLFALQDEAPAVVEDGEKTPAFDGMTMMQVTFAYPDTATVDEAEGINDVIVPDDALATDPRSFTRNSLLAARVQMPHVRKPNEKIEGDVHGNVLSNFSLDVPSRGILGIHGASGRGKSTMLKLLMRYWDPQQGRVYLADVALPEVNAHTRRREQTLMNQETFLFDGTIRENLQLADGGATDQALMRALEKASAAELVKSLPRGLDTRVGELGSFLSEGERQRIGLARVFLRDANLVLLDEPASRLDALNEAYILQSINEMAEERDVSIVLVSHRPSTLRVCDKTLYM